MNRSPYRNRRDGLRQVGEHVLVAEKAYGGRLPSGAVVHHVNHNRRDNRPSNLVILQDHAHHVEIHRREEAINACGNPERIKCPYCQEYDDPARLYMRPDRQLGYHRACLNAYQNARNRLKRERKSA